MLGHALQVTLPFGVLFYALGGLVAEWLACWTQAQ